jgi:hypothetical protein
MNMRCWLGLSRFAWCVLAMGTIILCYQGRGTRASAQQGGADPLDEVLPSPAKPAAPAENKPPANNPATKNGAAASEPKSPMVRAILKVLEEIGTEQGTEEERRLVREQLLQADAELAQSLGDNSRRKIMQANQKPRAFRIPTHEKYAAPLPRGKLVPGASGRVGQRPAPETLPGKANN